MGYGSSAENVLFFLSAIARAAAAQNVTLDASAGEAAAMDVLS